jgi:hypothetical protein
LRGEKTPALEAVEKLIQSSEFQRASAMIASGQKPQMSRGASMLAYSKPFVAFARSVGNPREMTDRQKWVMQALEAGNNNQN